MVIMNLDATGIKVQTIRYDDTKEAGIEIEGLVSAITLFSSSQETLEKVIAGLERAKIELERMKTKNLTDEPVGVIYNQKLSSISYEQR